MSIIIIPIVAIQLPLCISPLRPLSTLFGENNLNHFCEYPIELKYKSKAIETIVDDEYFKLKNHGAQDIGRYDYLYDISRIERLQALDKRFVAGYAVMLTNEPAYWKQPQTNQTVDAAFRTHEGRMLHGSLAWADNTGLGTSKGRTEPIVLEGNYVLHWNTYSEIPNTANGLFKICTVTVK
jgi:hypothetical protein